VTRAPKSAETWEPSTREGPPNDTKESYNFSNEKENRQPRRVDPILKIFG